MINMFHNYYHTDDSNKSICNLSEVAQRAIGLKTELTHARAVTLCAGDNFHSQVRSYNPERAKLFNGKQIQISTILFLKILK